MTFFYLITFISLFKNLLFKRIKLTFEKKINENIPFDEYMDELLWNNLVTKINLGSPLNSTDFMIRLQQYPLLIISEKVVSSHQKYNHSKSSTFKILNDTTIINPYSYFKKSKICKEYFKFDKVNMDLKCLLVNEINSDEGINYPVLLGLGLKEQIQKEKEYEGINFIEQLKEANLISSYVFTIKFIDNYKGEIIIGEKPEEYDSKCHSEAFRSVKTEIITASMVWSMSFDELYVNNKLIENDIVVKLKLESGVITPTYNLERYLNENYFDFYLKNSYCSKKMSDVYLSYYYICNKSIDIKNFPEINFHLKPFEMNFTLTYEDLIVEYQDKYFFLIVFMEYVERFEVGYPLMKKYQFVFDQDKKMIGLYKDFKKPFSFLNFFIFLFVFIIFCLLAFSSYVFYKKQRRKRQNEIDDNYEYFPNQNI